MNLLNLKKLPRSNLIITFVSVFIFIISFSASGQITEKLYPENNGKFELKKIVTGIKDTIVTGQFVNNSAYILTKNSHLFKLSSDSIIQQISIPDSILVQNLVFKNEQEGILIAF